MNNSEKIKQFNDLLDDYMFYTGKYFSLNSHEDMLKSRQLKQSLIELIQEISIVEIEKGDIK